MKLLKKILLLLLAYIFIFYSTIYANYSLFDAKEYNITIKNITGKISKIYLLQYGEKIDFKDVYGTNFDYDSFEIGEYELNTAYMDTMVNPFEKENYTENQDYNKELYKVNIEYSYKYKFSKGSDDDETSVEYYFSSKFNNFDELKQAIKNKEYGPIGSTGMIDIEYNSNTEKFINSSTLTCERTISYHIDKLTILKEISTNEIKNNQLKVSITDFESIKNIAKLHYDDGTIGYYGYAIRFFQNDKDYVTITCGNNIITQDAYIPTTPTTKDVEFDYQTGDETQSISNKNNNIIKNILRIIFAIFITLAIELFIAVIMKIRKYKIITIVNIVTQLVLHLLTFLGFAVLSEIPLHIYFILEIAIVFVEYMVYSVKIKEYDKKLLFLYSFLANLCSFGLSLLLKFVFNF